MSYIFFYYDHQNSYRSKLSVEKRNKPQPNVILLKGQIRVCRNTSVDLKLPSVGCRYIHCDLVNTMLRLVIQRNYAAHIKFVYKGSTPTQFMRGCTIAHNCAFIPKVSGEKGAKILGDLLETHFA